MPRTVVLVGEGDFSFSQAICALLKRESAVTRRESVFETIFKPCSEDLRLIVSSLDSREELLEKYPHFANFSISAEVHHSINALDPANYLRMCGSDRPNLVLWNHPHLGMENCQAHHSLLVHFFHTLSALEATVVVSLIEGQFERWRAMEAARLLGYQLVRKTRLIHSEFPGYVTRRNASGTSFQNSSRPEADSWFYFFAKHEEHAEVVNSPEDCDKNPIPSFLSSCELCDKSFRTVQGLATHNRQVHQLGKYEAKSEFLCDQCGKAFSTQDARKAHFFGAHCAKHMPKIPTKDSPNSPNPCSVCGSPEGEGHLERLAPPSACSICGRWFRDLRALSQHALRCGIS